MSEDVSKFLMQVKELGDRRIEEDEARSRELEERILRERKEREARRAERARSISPQKSSPVNTPPLSAHRRTDTRGSFSRLNLDSSPILEPAMSPHSHTSLKTDDMGAHGGSSSPSKENESPLESEHKPTTGQTSPTRATRGLSWQKRPNSQASERSRSRPLSVVAAENAARNTPPEPSSAIESIPRDQIASALSAKDPSWFRQTADRGASSAAYRRNQAEDNQTTDMSLLPAAQLPGMSGAAQGEVLKDDTSSRPTTPALPDGLGSPLSLSTSQRLDPPNRDPELEAETDHERSHTRSPSLGRISPSKVDRPVSPTKGMGGFVQSAMMKRSDSIKRWSIQSPPSAQRTDPVVSHRTGTRPRPGSIIRDAPIDLSPRPPSSREEHRVGELPSTEKRSDSPKLEIKLPQEPQEQDIGGVASPISPSKTMDSRRWSPTKASWLESALKKPESPKPKPTPAPASQPAWMAEIQKAKAEKAANPGAERSRSPTISHRHQVSIDGLMRSSAPGVSATKPPGLGVVLPAIGTSLSANIRTDNTSPLKDIQSPITPGIKNNDPETVHSPSPIESPVSATKPKPEAPLKKDFRANLKPRQPPPTSNAREEIEFKNVFSNLRKTTTQNYVAPDELKGNILKGKSALNTTGGPKKTERVDEFKEAILAKRKSFHHAQPESRGVARKDSIADEQPVPEALAKRSELGRSRDTTPSEPTVPDLRRPSLVTSKSDSTQGSPLDKPQHRFENRDDSLEIGAPKADRPTIPRRGSAQTVTVSKEAGRSATSPVAQKEANISGRLPGKLAGSALANRFNPALAGLLARGPPGPAPASSTGGISISSSRSNSASEGNGNEASSGPTLTHMTKGRARGPKRNAPTVTISTSTSTTDEPKERPADITPSGRPGAAIQPVEPIHSVSDSPVIASVDSSKMGNGELTNPKPQPISLIGPSKKPFEPAPEEVLGKAPNHSNKIHEQVAVFAQKRERSPTKGSDEIKEATSQPPSPRKLDVKRMSRFLDDSNHNVAKSIDPQLPKETKKETIRTHSPEKSKPISDQASSVNTSKLDSQSPPLDKPSGLLPDPISSTSVRQPLTDAINASSTTPKNPVTPVIGGRPLPPVPAAAGLELSSPRPPPKDLPPKDLPPKDPKQVPRPLPIPKSTSPPPAAPSMRSPTKQPYDAMTLLGDFFGPERPRRKYNVDAVELLTRRPSPELKTQTLSAQLFQLSGDGKKQAVPSHHERTLFEREMYICSHTFKSEAGKKFTEVYFWTGDEVPCSAAGDASPFASREAKAMGGKLIKLQQGKETPEFLQALGGVVIVQRGSSNKYDSLAPRMLCGRRYRGHIVFDEIDFSPAVLCSGFPYVVTAAGKCFIWKGNGSGVDELSCARLIGIDFALSGGIEEIEDGRETAAFWDLFNVNTKAVSADHWRLKPNYDKYCTRLFCSDASSKKQIVEISPFSQADLLQTSIYVLDAFFELYVIVGSRAQSQYASFHNALDFAQEYSILAAGMEDRPFVPFSTVVLEGIPRDMKSVFRKWRDTNNPTITNANTGLKRGRSLRVVPLNQALQALND
ncbi:hypothetical protein GGS23DRAFT_604131 [Durotheca rogersii]|uniref:uncharacterized protein n=1 Tax=Durotheca rogersii TaxID=419775 RepID=UPI00221F4323|nr:uncharacterized protein GGS23DRAFT_604131 [Durotheca rogersii]KAI5864483.1 hypothetical protein GGS23DRAFT_604131 [Durotheca rogersii]